MIQKRIISRFAEDMFLVKQEPRKWSLASAHWPHQNWENINIWQRNQELRIKMHAQKPLPLQLHCKLVSSNYCTKAPLVQHFCMLNQCKPMQQTFPCHLSMRDRPVAPFRMQIFNGGNGLCPLPVWEHVWQTIGICPWHLSCLGPEHLVQQRRGHSALGFDQLRLRRAGTQKPQLKHGLCRSCHTKGLREGLIYPAAWTNNTPPTWTWVEWGILDLSPSL